jgi:hypothetical protein
MFIHAFFRHLYKNLIPEFIKKKNGCINPFKAPIFQSKIPCKNPNYPSNFAGYKTIRNNEDSLLLTLLD